MRAELASLNICAIHFLSRAAAHLCWYCCTVYNMHSYTDNVSLNYIVTKLNLSPNYDEFMGNRKFYVILQALLAKTDINFMGKELIPKTAV